GVDLLALEHVSWELGYRVRGPSWLTFLGQPALDGLGGAAGLRDQLCSPGTTVTELGEGRVLITLGTWPEAGDTEQGHTLPAYRELARVLEPWRFHEEHPYSLGFTPEQLLRWERRFLD
ncbi:MAG TPA: type VI immunity family protein, partial [Myxococcus sp.]|nr:type VI immunity family protein [Myxococcus sp.]